MLRPGDIDHPDNLRACWPHLRPLGAAKADDGLSGSPKKIGRVWGLRKKPGVIVRPSIPEWAERPADYEELVSALNERGLKARIADNKGPPSGSDVPAFLPEAFAVFVGVKVADAILGTIVEEALRLIVERARVRWRPEREMVKGTIYGPDNEVLHEFKFEGVDQADQPHGHGSPDR